MPQPDSTYRQSFWDLLFACLKMLFRESVRWRLICLIYGFLIIMIFNINSHFERIEKIEQEKKSILQEHAFKIFFISCFEKEDFYILTDELKRNLQKYKAVLVQDAFIHRRNIYIDIMPLDKLADNPLQVIYNMFEINDVVKDFYKNTEHDDVIMKKVYIDYNGLKLDKNRHRKRSEKFTEEDFEPFSENLISFRRGDAVKLLRDQKEELLRLEKIQNEKEINPYLSKVQLIIPKNYLNIMVRMSRPSMGTDQIIESVQPGPSDFTMKVSNSILKHNTSEEMSEQESYAYYSMLPRYSTIYSKNFIHLKKGLSYYFFLPLIDYNRNLMKYLKELHSRGYYLFSYEKLHIIEYKLNKINQDIWISQVYFFIIEGIISIVFPYVLSLFAFIYLKKEIAFLLFHKNKIKLILVVFWFYPLAVMFILKLVYYLYFFGTVFITHLVIPLVISFFVVSFVFWWLNKACFMEFTDDNLNLYAIFKGN